MKYHNITKDDMLNGEGLRVVLWVSGCEHHCDGCQNPITWDPDDGLELMMSDLEEIEKEMRKDYISGLTITGGDPLYEKNEGTVELICQLMKTYHKDKTIWIYTGYTWGQVRDKRVMRYVDVLVDGRFKKDLLSPELPWVGSSNQRVIDVQQSLQKGEIILWDGSGKTWK